MKELNELILKGNYKELLNSPKVIELFNDYPKENLTEYLVKLIYENYEPLPKEELEKVIVGYEFIIVDGLTIGQLDKMKLNWITALVDKDEEWVVGQIKFLAYGIKELWELPIKLFFKSFGLLKEEN